MKEVGFRVWGLGSSLKGDPRQTENLHHGHFETGILNNYYVLGY